MATLERNRAVMPQAPAKRGRPRKSAPPPRQALKTAELAALVGVHPQTIRRAIESGQLKAAQTGSTGPHLISRTEAANWWKSRGGGELWGESAPTGESETRAIYGELYPENPKTEVEVKDPFKGDTPEARAAAILAEMESDDTKRRNLAIIALSQADEETSAIVEEAAARAVEEWEGEDDDFADWRALDSEPFHFPEEAPDYLQGLYRADATAKADEVADTDKEQNA